MAIVIEEGKRKINWFYIIVGLSLIAMLAVFTYYFFFSPAPLIERVIPENVQSVRIISSRAIKPDEIINHPNFSKLKQQINPIELPASRPARDNPFRP